ncbi:hypothetical protein ACFQ0H_31365 [Lysobacter gummosus]|uniref:hypothetical protein n=1 Tax=Lysobacter gummosus TaxID=262324 RepID=UPI00363BB067
MRHRPRRLTSTRERTLRCPNASIGSRTWPRCRSSASARCWSNPTAWRSCATAWSPRWNRG